VILLPFFFATCFCTFASFEGILAVLCRIVLQKIANLQAHEILGKLGGKKDRGPTKRVYPRLAQLEMKTQLHFLLSLSLVDSVY
jgi:hypothetical protein